MSTKTVGRFNSKAREAKVLLLLIREFIREFHHVRSIMCTVVFVLVVLIGQPALAHEDRTPTGSWEGIASSTTVQIPPLTTHFTFGADGNLVESRRLYLPQSPLDPLLATPGHGEWRRSRNGGFDATIVLLYQGAPEHPTSPGIVIGREKVRYKFQLVNGGEQIQGTFLVEVQDAAGNVVFSGPGTIQATRIRAEPLP